LCTGTQFGSSFLRNEANIVLKDRHVMSSTQSEPERQNDAGSQEPPAVPLISTLAVCETIETRGTKGTRGAKLVVGPRRGARSDFLGAREASAGARFKRRSMSRVGPTPAKSLFWILAQRNIPYPAMSETSSNCWKLSVIRVSSLSASVAESPSSVSSRAPKTLNR
jgi:hypothetical protein